MIQNSLMLGSKVGLRGKQNIFQICDFLVSVASFKHLKLHEVFLKHETSEKRSKIRMESLGFEPLPQFLAV